MTEIFILPSETPILIIIMNYLLSGPGFQNAGPLASFDCHLKIRSTFF